MLSPAIDNTTEFYPHHYLDEVLAGDLDGIRAAWREAGSAAPPTRLAGLGAKYRRLRALAEEEGPGSRLDDGVAAFHAELLEALGYSREPSTHAVAVSDGADLAVPVLAARRLPGTETAHLLVCGDGIALPPSDADRAARLEDDPFRLPVRLAAGSESQDLTWSNAFDAIFAAEIRPRFVLYLAGAHLILLESHKWAQGRFLRVDLDLAYGRKDTTAFFIAAALCSGETLLPEGEQLLHDRLEENAHKHAFGVTKDLKNGIIHAVELLGNCWAEAEIARRQQQKRKLFDDAGDPQGRATAARLKTEAMRFLYRLLFLFYVEARPDLDVVPMKAEAYQRGYSLDSLRELEQAPLSTPQAREGSYFQQHLERLFQIVFKGYSHEPFQTRLMERGDEEEAPLSAGFTVAPLVAELFDPANTELLNSVELNRKLTGNPKLTRGLAIPNHILQAIVQSLSLSAADKRRGRGRISYATLGIEQLGSVYESLLSYTGFFATEDLLELKRKQDKEDNPDKQTWFAPATEQERFHKDELIWEDQSDGRGRTPRILPEGTFVFRLAGRDRTESASFYTPKVLTEALVKYSLMELISDGIKPLKERQEEERLVREGKKEPRQKPTADQILEMTILDSAMGCGSFLTEAIDQLAQAYLERKQEEAGVRIPVHELERERSRVKHHLAIRNCYGVDLNPIAVELAQTSLWLACIHQGASVPWFGLRLATGNSLIGARRAWYPAHQLLDGTWAKTPPQDHDWHTARPLESVYHFLVPTPEMLQLGNDKVVKDLAPEATDEIRDWHKDVAAKWSKEEVTTLIRLSAEMDRLFSLYEAARRKVLDDVTPRTRVWAGATLDKDGSYTPAYAEFGRTEATLHRQREELLQLHATSSAYQRLKLAMDSWSALWFWPLSEAKTLPGRGLWLTLMELCLVDQATSQNLTDEAFAGLLDEKGKEVQSTLFEQHEKARQLTLADSLKAGGEDTLLAACSGGVDTALLAQERPFFATVLDAASRHHFHHWELAFPEVFRQGGFDLQVGNPPWLKVEWEERGILGDLEPAIGLKGMSSSDAAKQRPAILTTPERVELYLQQKSRFEGMQHFLNSATSYEVLKGIQTNLYKCFIVRSWWLGHAARGMVGLFHQAGMFDDPKGGTLREEQYHRLEIHIHSPNKMKLFTEVHDCLDYEWCCFRAKPKSTCLFAKTSNIMHPQALTRSLDHDGHGTVPGIKDASFHWDISGHANRLVPIDEVALAKFAELLDPPGTPPLQARLPVVHSREILSVLARFAEQPQKLGDLAGQWAATEFFHERNTQTDGTIRRDTQQLTDIHDWVLQGPHFYVATPFNKTPNEGCRHNQDYSVIDLTTLPADFLPRTNYVPACDRAEYEARIPTWQRPLPDGTTREERFDERYRHVNRRQLAITGERSLIPAVAPPGACNVDGVFSICFEDDSELLIFNALCSALPMDFFVRATGKSDLRYSTAAQLPFPASPAAAPFLLSRTLRLNCLTTHYADLWQDQWQDAFASDCFTRADHRLSHANEVAARRTEAPLTYRDGRYAGDEAAQERGSDVTWGHCTATWDEHSALRTDYARRQALVELDALAALALGLTLEELLTIYRVQFPVLQEYEHNDRYDQLGRKLPTKALRAWEKEKARDKDTVPFPFEEVTYYPPFTRCRREDDMTRAYEAFQAKAQRPDPSP